MAYQEAFSFRSSHYFICYLSEAAMIVGGFDSDLQKKQKELKSIGAYSATTTTHPLSIEFPRSLVKVVICWNIPTHIWLKNCNELTESHRDYEFYNNFISRCISSVQTLGQFLCDNYDLLNFIVFTRF